MAIFVNQRGRICLRMFDEIIPAPACVKPLEIGDWVEMAIDLEKQVATFNVWARAGLANPFMLPQGQPTSTAEFPYGMWAIWSSKQNANNAKGQKPVDMTIGHLACVVKNQGV